MMMELNPTFVRAPVGTNIEFCCKYYKTERLDILVYENGIAINRESKYMRCEHQYTRTWLTKVSNKTTIVQCMLQNKQNLTLGLLTAYIYPGLKLFIVNIVLRCISSYR